MKVSVVGALVCLAALSGCASIVNGVSQPISVETQLNGEPLAGAGCKLSSNKGTWFVTTPGSLTVHRGFQDLLVECSKAGVAPSVDRVASHVKAMAFGNILFGGIIGIAVDSGDGAAFDYPDLITIDMGRGRGDSPAMTDAGSMAPGSSMARAPAPVATSIPVAIDRGSASGPVVGVRAPATPPSSANARHEYHYLVAAESFAKTQSCTARPVATFTAAGPGYETYAVSCKPDETLAVRCDYGVCRVVR